MSTVMTPPTALQIASFGAVTIAVQDAKKRKNLTLSEIGAALYPGTKNPSARCYPWYSGKGPIPAHKRAQLAELLGLDASALTPAQPSPAVIPAPRSKPVAARPAPAAAPGRATPGVSPLIFEVRPDGMVSIRLNIVTGFEKGTALVRLLLDATDLAGAAIGPGPF